MSAGEKIPRDFCGTKVFGDSKELFFKGSLVGLQGGNAHWRLGAKPHSGEQKEFFIARIGKSRGNGLGATYIFFTHCPKPCRKKHIK